MSNILVTISVDACRVSSKLGVDESDHHCTCHAKRDVLLKKCIPFNQVRYILTDLVQK